MVHENVKDKEAKVRYLEKIIDCISFSTGENLQVRPGENIYNYRRNASLSNIWNFFNSLGTSLTFEFFY